MEADVRRQQVQIEGIVQGVGFRPFVYRIAQRWAISGWVRNDGRGVTVEAEGPLPRLAGFLWSLRSEIPPLASISRFELRELPVTGDEGFAILASDSGAERSAQIAPDSTVCSSCLQELFDSADRRHRYPFINCIDCGPRYSIVTGIPYDRALTTMAGFAMCPACRAEYDDPASRRFHAQPNACPDCGPRLRLTDDTGTDLPGDPLERSLELLHAGQIVAVKGLGGYHLAVDAGNAAAVLELRRRKARDEKPFALMSAESADVLTYAEADAAELQLLGGSERPIVLLRQKARHALAAGVAPGNRFFGVMLAYTPLHHLLLRDHFTALVMTSGNRSDEPIAFTEDDARSRLGGIADVFLSHNRPIQTRLDDSIARFMAGRAVLLRRSRGYVPRGIVLPRSQPPVLAVGAELKNTVCLTRGDRAYLSQHLGDLQYPGVLESFTATIHQLERLLDLRPEIVAHDLHPDYGSTRYAEEQTELPRVAVQHHHAHLASCLAENGVEEPAIGVIFDGLGYGADGRFWGGEFLVGNAAGYRRAGHFAYLPLPGGDAATREPLRMALSLLHHAYGRDLPDLPLVRGLAPKVLELTLQMIEKGLNSPLASSCGRLFDAVAALAGIRERITFEGQAALELEMAALPGEHGGYPYDLNEIGGMLVFDPAVLARALVADLQRGVPAGQVSARFHTTLAWMAAEVCARLRNQTGIARVALSGGVFQNRLLTETLVPLLLRAEFTVHTHCRVPPNDGGLALGQAVIAGCPNPA
jgi:hydrogenase maturation protein HypF